MALKSKKKTFILDDNSGFLMKEDYRALRTNLTFSFPDEEEGARVIAITSAEQHSGKSTTAVNLAISFGELDKKVLIIDCDLRFPTVAEKLSIVDDGELMGLTNLLVNECKVNDAIKKLSAQNIYVLTAGTIPPDPTRLLQSSKFKAVIDKLRELFDFIIIDCPPINIVIDAAVLSPVVDGYLIVVKHGESDKRAIAAAVDQMRMANGNILGFVYCNAPTSDQKDYKAKGYGYGYGYGQKQGKE